VDVGLGDSRLMKFLGGEIRAQIRAVDDDDD
jgi:hypothetical protein